MNGSALSAAQCAFRLAGVSIGSCHGLVTREPPALILNFCIRSRLGPFNLCSFRQGTYLAGKGM